MKLRDLPAPSAKSPGRASRSPSWGRAWALLTAGAWVARDRLIAAMAPDQTAKGASQVILAARAGGVLEGRGRRGAIEYRVRPSWAREQGVIGHGVQRGAGAKRYVRPETADYPADRAFAYLRGRVRLSPEERRYKTHAEISRREQRRQRWLDSVGTDADGCWVWLPAPHPSGQVWFSDGRGRTISPFRFLLDEWMPNRPDEMAPLRTRMRCGKRNCVRPACRVQRRGGPIGRHPSAGKLTEDQVREVRRLRGQGLGCRATARVMGLPRTTIQSAYDGTAYRWVVDATEPARAAHDSAVGATEPPGAGSTTPETV